MTSCQNNLLFSFFPLPSTNLRPATFIVGELLDNKVLIWKIRCQDNFQTAWIIMFISFPRASRKRGLIVYYLYRGTSFGQVIFVVNVFVDYLGYKR